MLDKFVNKNFILQSVGDMGYNLELYSLIWINLNIYTNHINKICMNSGKLLPL